MPLTELELSAMERRLSPTDVALLVTDLRHARSLMRELLEAVAMGSESWEAFRGAVREMAAFLGPQDNPALAELREEPTPVQRPPKAIIERVKKRDDDDR